MAKQITGASVEFNFDGSQTDLEELMENLNGLYNADHDAENELTIQAVITVTFNRAQLESLIFEAIDDDPNNDVISGEGKIGSLKFITN